MLHCYLLWGRSLAVTEHQSEGWRSAEGGNINYGWVMCVLGDEQCCKVDEKELRCFKDDQAMSSISEVGRKKMALADAAGAETASSTMDSSAGWSTRSPPASP